jgi:Phosphotransferase enzyme family
VPSPVKQRAESLLGAPITRALRVWGGYAPSATFRLILSDGRRAVFKGTYPTSNEVMPKAIRDEERVYRELGSLIQPWAPTCFGSIEHADWFALVLEDLGPPQVPPWTSRRAAAALRDYARFHAATLGRTDLPTWLRRDRHHSVARTWRELAESRGGLDGTASLASRHAAEARDWLARHIEELVAAAERLIDIDPPHALLHFDTRSDNLRIQPGGRLRLFDWPYTCVGPPEFDMVAFVQSIAAEGGPQPEQCVGWYAEGMPVREKALVASIAAIAGYFADRAWQPPIPGLPRVRDIQRRQLRSSLAWCARQLRLSEPTWLAAVPD